MRTAASLSNAAASRADRAADGLGSTATGFPTRYGARAGKKAATPGGENF